jgi:hypothetical protein
VDVRGAHVDGEFEEAVKVFHRKVSVRSRCLGSDGGGSDTDLACARFGRSRNIKYHFEALALLASRALHDHAATPDIQPLIPRALPLFGKRISTPTSIHSGMNVSVTNVMPFGVS